MRSPLRSVLVAVTVLAAAAVPSRADGPSLRRLDDAGLTATFVGAAIEGVYATGKPMSEHMRADGTTDYVEDDVHRPGRYWVADGLICFDYGIANTGGCFEVWQRSANCYDNYVVHDGDARATFLARMTGYGWDSRMWRIDDASTCPADAVANAARSASPA